MDLVSDRNSSHPQCGSSSTSPSRGPDDEAAQHREWLRLHNVSALFQTLVEELLTEKPDSQDGILRCMSRWSEEQLRKHLERQKSEQQQQQQQQQKQQETGQETPSAAPSTEPLTINPHGIPHTDSNSQQQQSANHLNENERTGGQGGEEERTDLPSPPTTKSHDEAKEDESRVVEKEGDEEGEEEGEGRPHPVELEELFPSPAAAGITLDDHEEVVGRGNYGYVKRGTIAVVDGGDPDQVRQQPQAIHNKTKPGSNSASNKTDAALPSSVMPCAIKIIPIKSFWTLDEVKFSQLITDHIKAAVVGSQSKQKKNTTLAPYAAKKALQQKHQHSEEEEEAEGATSGGLVVDEGAKCVLQVVGPAAYDPVTDALWLPLEWAPYSLADIAKQRRVQRRDAASAVRSQHPLLFSLPEMQHVARQMLLAILFLSERCGVVHLDLKPANILSKVPWPWWYKTSTKGSADEAENSNVSNRTKQAPGGGAGLAPKSAEQEKKIPSSSGTGGGSKFSRRLPKGNETTVPTPTTTAPSSSVMPQLLLADFGLVQYLGDRAVQLGDFYCMSPEIYWAGYDHNTVNGRGDSGGGGATTNIELLTPPATEYSSTHDVWSVACLLLWMMEDGEQWFTWKPEDLFRFLEENYVVPMAKNPSRWPPSLLHWLVLCFERDPWQRPSACQLLQHAFLTEDFSSWSSCPPM